MDRRNFFRSMIGGVAAAAAVRTWPFRVFSFPTDLRMVIPITTSSANNFVHAGDVQALDVAAIQAIELENIQKQIPDLLLTESMWYRRLLGLQQSIRLDREVKWAAVDPACEQDNETARTINKLISMGLLK